MPTAISSEIMDRLPPQSLEAERAVLGSLLLDPRLCDEVAPLLVPDDFYADANRRLFANVVAMHDAGKRIDVALLVDHLRRAGELEAIGGVVYLAEIAHSVPVAAHALYYAAIVHDRALRRRIIHAATALMRDAWDESRTSEEIVGECEAKLQEIPTGEYAGEPVSLKCAIVDASALVDEIASRRRAAGLMIGLSSFDLEVGGLFPGELIVLAARPSVGKTAMALQVARHVAGKGRLVYFASLEMGATQLALRLLCGESGVAMSRVRSGDVGADELAEIVKAGAACSSAPVMLHDRAGLAVADIRRACRRLAPKGLSLIVVDYLQRVSPEDRRADRHLQIGQITWALKALALELKVPVVALSQLGRAAEERDKKSGLVIEPRLSHLKESGDIEQDADMVALLHRQQRASEAVLILAKNRQGEQGKFALVWDAARTRFACVGSF